MTFTAHLSGGFETPLNVVKRAAQMMESTQFRGHITQTGDERTAAVHPRSSSFILVHPRSRLSALARRSAFDASRAAQPL